MKIRVERAMRANEVRFPGPENECVIDLILPVQVSEGTHLDKIVDAAGVEYFFTKDGYYDGYGGVVAGLDDRIEE